MEKYVNEVLKILERSKNFGYHKLKNGTKLFGNTKHIAPQAWFHQIFPPIGVLDLEQLLNEIGIPDVYCKFLLLMNGLNAFSCSISFFGLRTNYKRTIESVLQQPFNLITPNTIERPINANDDHFFIGSYCEDGSLIYLNIYNMHVYRRAREDFASLNEWPNLGEMLLSEIQRLHKLFDNKGIKINDKITTLP